MDIVAGLAHLQKIHPQKKVHMLWVGTGELSDALHDACNIRYEAGKGLLSGDNSSKPAASFAGFLNQSEIARAYVAADALVLPSDAKETWGLVTNEAMASGLPCIVSAEVGCADDLILPHFPEFCFPMGDMDALATAMGRMIDNPPTAEKVHEIIDAYDCKRTVESVARLYEQQFGSRSNQGI